MKEPYQEEITRVKIVVHTTSGKTFESMVMDLGEAEAAKWADAVRKMKDLSTLYIPLVHALGWTQNVYLNPAFVIAVEVIIVPDKV